MVWPSPLLRTKALAAIAAVLALVAVSCTSTGETTSTPPTTAPATAPPTTPSPPTTTTTEPPPTSIPGETSDSVDPEVDEQLRAQIAELIATTEEVRGLPFLETPSVTVLDAEAFAGRVEEILTEDLDPAEVAVDSRFFSMMGMLEPGTDLYDLLIGLYTEQVLGYYSHETGELVVAGDESDLSAFERMVVLHELVHALTDQHFSYGEEIDRRADEGNGDDASALQALFEGDAFYFQLVYMESLSPLEQLSVAVDLLGFDQQQMSAVPAWLQADLLFPYESGFRFIERLVAEGGIAAVDHAYVEIPGTSEQVLDADRYLRGEGALALEPVTATLPGWEVHDEGALGQWGLQLVFNDTLPPGLVTQVGSGWGGDSYRIFADEDDVAFVLHYRGDAERDAEEVANALITHTRDAMGAGDGVETDGGLLYGERSDLYVFIDRIGDELFYIASTDPAAGAALTEQI